MQLSVWNIKRNLASIEKIIVWTEQGRQWYERNLPEATVVVIPAPVDTDFFTPSAERTWLPDGNLRILMNARFLAFKRHRDLLVAVRDLIQAGRSVSVSLIGSMDLGMDDITNLITELDLNDVVTIVPPRPHADMSALYHSHDVLVLPSYNEAIGMVVPEAMACGISTITSDTVGANVYVAEGITGYVFNTGNVQDLSEKIDSCFDAVSLQKMGELARQEILKYSIPEIRSKWQQLL